jgi:hypothetical protein
VADSLLFTTLNFDTTCSSKKKPPLMGGKIFRAMDYLELLFNLIISSHFVE